MADLFVFTPRAGGRQGMGESLWEAVDDYFNYEWPENLTLTQEKVDQKIDLYYITDAETGELLGTVVQEL